MVRKRKSGLSVLLFSAVFISFMTSFMDIKSIAAETKIQVEKGSDISEFDTIQAAIDSVQDNESAVISVPAGSYDEAIAITNTKGKLNRSIVLKGAQANNSAVVNGNPRSSTETILTNGIAINGLHEDASITIDGFTLKNKGINIQGWGNLIDSTGNLRIINNVISDVEDGTVSAIHVNGNGATEFIGTFAVENNYIADIGAADNATNGIYFTLTADHMKINHNVIRNVNHTCINFASATINTEASIIGNVFANWNYDGDSGSGALGSQGDGIYITKTNTLVDVPINIHQNSFSRDEALPGSKGWAVRCANKKGQIDLSENYWDSEFPLSVISGGTYANVTISSVCDETMTVTKQSIANLSFSASDLYKTGKANENKLSVKITMLKQSVDEPTAVYTTDTPEIIALETRADGVYAVAKKAGKGNVIATVSDPASNQEYQLEQELFVRDIEMSDQTLELNETIQMTYQLLPQGDTLPVLAKATWESLDEDIATVDENGLVTSTGKEGDARIEITIKRLGTVLYQTSAIVSVKAPVVNTAPVIYGSDKELSINDDFDPFQDITAMDQEDGDLSDAVTIISNDVDMSKPGIYHVTYQVTDSEGAVANKTITVTVKELETVKITIAAIMEGKPGVVAAEYDYVKGYELTSEKLNEFIALADALKETEAYLAYEYQGLFLDKEATMPLELGYHFNENTLIYMLWSTKESEVSPPIKPIPPVKPNDDLKPGTDSYPNTDSKPNTANPDKSDYVQTGDNSQAMQYLSLLWIAGFICAAFYKIEKRINQK